MLKRFLIGITVFLIAAAILIFINWQRIFQRQHVHYHAGFQVYVNGNLQDFSDTKYMDLTPCNGHSTENNQLAKAHLHENVGDVVHVHRTGSLWSDLFKNIGFKIDSREFIEGFVNGNLVQNVLNTEIEPYDSLVLIIGTHGNVDDYLSHAVTIGHIKTIEKTSELCGS